MELDHQTTGQPYTEETARDFIESVIFPTLERAEELAQDSRIIAGGPVAGRIALRFITEVDSAQELDQLVSSLPLWTVAKTRVTPLIDFSERRTHVEALLERLTKP